MISSLDTANFLVVPGQRLSGDGMQRPLRNDDVSDPDFSALALKALDQRLANSATNSSIQNGPSTSQSSRTSLATPAPPPVDRKPSPDETDGAETVDNEPEGK